MSYTENDIKKLSPIEHVRLRPLMYIEHTDNPLPLLCEIIDNSLDEVLNVRGQHQIDVVLNYDSCIISVQDSGRGIPYNKTRKEKIPAIILVATDLFAGGKFHKDHESSYKISAGLHGVGLSVVNYLSKKMKIVSVRDGNVATAIFEDGKNISLNIVPNKDNLKKGTYVEFNVIDGIFSKRMPDIENVVNYCKTILLDPEVHKKVKIRVSKIENSKHELYEIDNKIEDLEDFKNLSTIIKFEGISDSGEEFFVAFSYDNAKDIKSYGLVNLKPVHSGTHITLFKSLILDKMEELSKKFCKIELNRNDLLMGLRLFVSIKISDVQYVGQAKTALKTPIPVIKKVFNEQLNEFVESITKGSRLTFLKAVLQRIEELKKRTKNIKAIETFLSNSTNGITYQRGLPDVDNLYDCSKPITNGTELYIVEGASAGGTLLKIRDQEKHGVLLLRGKTVNSLYESKSTEDLLKNKEVVAILKSLGIDLKNKDTKTLRYEKIILMSDPDPDGCHINLLVLSILARFVPQVLLNGHVYILEIPLYMFYIKNELKPIFDKKEAQNLMNSGLKFTRYKGLGEIDSDEMSFLVFSSHRRIVKLNCKESDIEYLKQLMTTQVTKKEILD